MSAGYYYSDLPFLALYGAKYLPIAAPITEFFTDASSDLLFSSLFFLRVNINMTFRDIG